MTSIFNNLACFNMQHGFVEAIVRGFRSGFLSDESYHHLSQCETLEVVNNHDIYIRIYIDIFICFDYISMQL
jgi:hypothetical protein